MLVKSSQYGSDVHGGSLTSSHREAALRGVDDEFMQYTSLPSPTNGAVAMRFNYGTERYGLWST